MSKEELLTSLLKSKQSIAEFRKSKSNNAEIERIFKKSNGIRNNFSKEKIKEIRKKIYEREKIDKYFKELEKKYSLKNETKKYQQEPEKKNITSKN